MKAFKLFFTILLLVVSAAASADRGGHNNYSSRGGHNNYSRGYDGGHRGGHDVGRGLLEGMLLVGAGVFLREVLAPQQQSTETVYYVDSQPPQPPVCTYMSRPLYDRHGRPVYSHGQQMMEVIRVCQPALQY